MRIWIELRGYNYEEQEEGVKKERRWAWGGPGVMRPAVGAGSWPDEARCSPRLHLPLRILSRVTDRATIPSFSCELLLSPVQLLAEFS